MRIIVTFLVLLGILMLALSGVLALHAQHARKHSVTAPGVVTALNDGPYHAEVSVQGANGRRFDYVENSSERPLAVGQALTVRYSPATPEQTARVEQGGANLPLEIAGVGLFMILAAFASPVLVKRFPGLFAFAIRP